MKFFYCRSLLFVITVFITVAAFSQSIKPATGFGNNGRQFINYANDAPTVAYCIAQVNGKIIIGGNIITRLFPDGKIDSSFNGAGFYFDPSLNVGPASMAVQADDKIVTLYTVFDDSSFYLKRITADGRPDESYGNNGVNRFTVPGIKLQGSRIFLQADGKLLLAGSAEAGGTSGIFVARLLPSGLPDTSFNHTGYSLTNFENENAYGRTLAIQAGGQIVITGVIANLVSSQSRVIMMRLNADGSFDETFNASTGKYIAEGLGIGGIAAGPVTIQPDNKIIMVGGSNAQLMVIRLNENGEPDNNFNGSGTLFTQIGLFNSPESILIRPGGKILIALSTAVSDTDPSSWNYGALQLNENGTEDNSFNGTGNMSISISVLDHCAGGVLQEDGRLILAGYANEASLITLIGVDNAGQVDFNFGLGGIRILQLLGTSERMVAALERQDKKIVVVGQKNDGVLDKSNIILFRYQQGGKNLDPSFGNNGKTGIVRDVILKNAALQSSGKIVVSGTLFDDNNFNYKSIVFRFTENGFLDYSFALNTNFSYLSPGIFNHQTANNLFVQPDDKILTAFNNNADNKIYLVRLTAEGDPDLSFGDNGKAVFNPGPVNYIFNNLVLQPDGKILMAAREDLNNGDSHFILIRFSDDGQLDNSFNGTGIKTLAVTSYYGGEDNNIALAVQPDGKITIAATVVSYNEHTEEYAASLFINRLNDDGTDDVAFNSTGILTIPSAQDAVDYINDIVTHSDSSILISVNRSEFINTKTYPVLIKLNAAGQTDSTVSADGNGFLVTGVPGAISLPGIKVLQDSTILTSGDMPAGNRGSDLYLSSYMVRKTVPYKFIGNGNWTDAANWDGGIVPPAILPDGAFIFIQPVTGGSCILNTEQHIAAGNCIVVYPGKNFIVQGNLTIN
ncbi:MAG: hypothetical protein QM791_01810 [Ferruginibacter sp.]